MTEVFTAEQLRKQTFKLALSAFGKSLLATVFGMVMFLSLGLIGTVNQELLGYRVYSDPNGLTGKAALFNGSYDRYDEYRVTKEGEPAELEGSYVYDIDAHEYVYSAELTALTETAAPTFDKEEAEKQIEQGKDVNYAPVYAERTTLKTVVDVVSQVFMLLLLFALIYSVTWQQGDKDHNFEDFGRMQADKYRGLRVGLLASVPSGILVLCLLISKLTGLMPNFIFWYRLGTLLFAPINNALSAGTAWTANVTFWILPVAVLCWALLPLIAHIGYRFGYNRYSIGEHFIYKNLKKK